MNDHILPVQQLKVLTIVFNSEIQGHEIPAFRGAIANKVGHRHVLFHNHLGDQYRYHYPMIQYKRLYGKAAIVCLGMGVDEIHHFFSQQDWSIQLSGRHLPLKVEKLDLNQFTMQVWDKWFHYRLHNWIALNQHSYREYQQLRTEADRFHFLQRKLIGNILSFAKGIHWHVDKPIEIEMLSCPPPRTVRIKDTNVMAFQPEFRTNVFLPLHLGLGKRVSVGYGVVRRGRDSRSFFDDQ